MHLRRFGVGNHRFGGVVCPSLGLNLFLRRFVIFGGRLLNRSRRLLFAWKVKARLVNVFRGVGYFAHMLFFAANASSRVCAFFWHKRRLTGP